MAGPKSNPTTVWGTKNVTGSSNQAVTYASFITWTDDDDNLFFFGGRMHDINTDYSYLPATWKFDGTNWTWVDGPNELGDVAITGTKGVAASANRPGGVGFSKSVIGPNGDLWFFGGQGYDSVDGTTSGYLSDLWMLDL